MDGPCGLFRSDGPIVVPSRSAPGRKPWVHRGDRLAESAAPVIGVEGDLIHEPACDRAGRADPLLPGTDGAGVHAEEFGEQRLAQSQKPAHQPHVIRTVFTHSEIESMRTDGEPPLQGFARIEGLEDFFEGLEDLGSQRGAPGGPGRPLRCGSSSSIGPG